MLAGLARSGSTRPEASVIAAVFGIHADLLIKIDLEVAAPLARILCTYGVSAFRDGYAHSVALPHRKGRGRDCGLEAASLV